MRPGVQTDGRTGDGFDHDNRFGSFASPRDRQIATLRYQAANADRLYKSALAQSEQVAESLAEYGHDQANSYNLGGPQGRRQTLADAPDMDDVPDNSWVDDDKVDGLDYDDHGRGRRGQGRAATGKFPGQAHFTDGTTIKVRRYRRPRHLQADLDRYEAAVGAPVLRYSDDELAALGLTKSTTPFDMQLLF
jgi:hypothetical protein